MFFFFLALIIYMFWGTKSLKKSRQISTLFLAAIDRGCGSMKKFQPQPVPKSALYKSITSKIIKLESWNYGQIEALIMQIIKLM